MRVGKTTLRWGIAGIGGVLLVFGYTCLNYTKAWTIEHHQAWALEHGAPAPGPAIHWCGFASAALGGLALGLSLALRRTADAG